MENTKPSIDPLKGVHKPELLVEELRKLRAGSSSAKSYIRGSLQWLERHPPNKQIVPLLKAVLKKY